MIDTRFYEVVKTVNGHDIYRMKGTKGFYHVDTKVINRNCKTTHVFKTQKAAAAFCETF